MPIPDDDTTDLWCSRCQSLIISIPGTLDWEGSISVALAMDLCRLSVQHGYVCSGRPDE